MRLFCQFNALISGKLRLINDFEWAAVAKYETFIDCCNSIGGDCLAKSGYFLEFTLVHRRDHRDIMVVAEHAHYFIGNIFFNDHNIGLYLVQLRAQYFD